MISRRARTELAHDGFTVLHDVIGLDALEHLRRRVESLLEVEPPETLRAHKALGSLISVARDPELVHTIVSPAILATLDDFGPVRFSGGYVLSKPPDAPPTFWHQDWYFWDDEASYRETPAQIGVLIYLVDTRPENGCLRILPGSHLRLHPMHEVLARSDVVSLRRGDDPHAKELAVQFGEVSVTTTAGDVVLFDARVLHAAHANNSGMRRTGITLWYFPQYDRLSQSIQALASAHGAFDEWPQWAQLALEPLRPNYFGTAHAAHCVEHPDRSRMRPRAP